MSNSQQTPVNEGFVFRRTLRLGPGADGPVLAQRLEQLPGLLEVTVDDRGRLRLRYDASQLQIDQVVAQIHQRGAVLDAGVGAGLRLRWYRFVDANAAQNAGRTDVHCCNKPPKGY